MLQHGLHNIFVRKLLEGFIRISKISLYVRVGVSSHRSSDVLGKFVDDLVEVVLKFVNILLVLLYLLQRLLHS
jgi:hypothetical protein